MDGILLQRSEFLVLLDAVKAPGVIGLPRETFPRETGEFRALVLDGIRQLRQRGLLDVRENINVLNADLLALATAVAYPQLAIITTRAVPGAGQQLFLHYAAAGMVVEQTFPEERVHRLVALANRRVLIERLLAILAVPAAPPAEAGQPEISVTLPQALLVDVKAKAEAGQREVALKALEAAGLAASAAQALVESFQEPVVGSAVVVAQCRQGQVTDSRNAALVQGHLATWLITPTEPEAATFKVQTATVAALAKVLLHWTETLAPTARR